MKNKYEIKQVYKKTEISYFSVLFNYKDFKWFLFCFVIVSLMLFMAIYFFVSGVNSIALATLTSFVSLFVSYILIMNKYMDKHKKEIIDKYLSEIINRCKKEKRCLSKYGYKKDDFKEIWEVSNLRFRLGLEDNGYIPTENIDIEIIKTYKGWFPERSFISISTVIITLSSVLFSAFLTVLCGNIMPSEDRKTITVNWGDGTSTVMNLGLFEGLCAIGIGLFFVCVLACVLNWLNEYFRTKFRYEKTICDRLDNILIEALTSKQREKSR